MGFQIEYASKLNKLSAKGLLKLSSFLGDQWDILMCEYPNSFDPDDKERIELASRVRRIPPAEILLSELRQSTVSLKGLYKRLAKLGFIGGCLILESEMNPELVKQLRTEFGITDD